MGYYTKEDNEMADSWISLLIINFYAINEYCIIILKLNSFLNSFAMNVINDLTMYLNVTNLSIDIKSITVYNFPIH